MNIIIEIKIFMIVNLSLIKHKIYIIIYEDKKNKI